MTDLSPLAAELRKPQYSDMSDQQAAAAINSLTVAYRRRLRCAEVKSHAIKNGYWAAIDIGCDSSTTSTRRLCRNVRAYIEDSAGKIETLDIDSPVVATMLDQLMALQMMTAANRAELSAMAAATMPWTQSVGIGEVGIGYVQNARRMIAEASINAQ